MYHIMNDVNVHLLFLTKARRGLLTERRCFCSVYIQALEV